MSRVTILAFFFPPIREIGYRRPLRLANYLAARGDEVTVYAGHPAAPGLGDYACVDRKLNAVIDPRVHVVRTPSFHGWKMALRLRARVRTLLGRTPHARTAAGRPPAPRKHDEAPRWPRLALLRQLFRIPDPYSGWILTTFPLMLARSLVRRPTAIFVTAPPWSPLLVAVATGRLLRIPVHVDFRDPWLLNPYLPSAAISARLERWVFRHCASVMANTAALADELRRRYPDATDRIVPIYNGYDDAVRERMEGLRSGERRSPGAPFVVAHIGILYPERMPAVLAALLARVAATWRGSRPIRFRFIGPVWEPQPLVDAFAAAGASATLELVGEVPSATAERESVKADVRLLLQLGTRFQVPAKVFEYVFAGDAMLCVADEGSETARLVSDYSLGKVFDLSARAEDISAYLLSVCDAPAARETPPPRFLADFDGTVLAARMADLILEAPGAHDAAMAPLARPDVPLGNHDVEAV